MREFVAYLLPEDQQGAQDWRIITMLETLDIIENSVRYKIQGVDFAKADVDRKVPFVELNGKAKSFDNLWKGVKNGLFKFGRYSTWFYLQHLKHTCDIKIVSTSMMLNDFSGSRSHRNGLLMGLGREDDYDKKLTKEEYEYLEGEAKDIITETKSRYPEIASEADNFTFETCLCSYKKIFRRKHGRYLGYYLDRQAEEITQVSRDKWHGIEWEVLWQAREETLDERLIDKSGIKKKWFDLYLDNGYINRVDWLEG